MYHVMHVITQRGQKNTWNPLKLEVKVATWVLGREPNLDPLLEREVLLAVETSAPLLYLNVLLALFSVRSFTSAV